MTDALILLMAVLFGLARQNHPIAFVWAVTAELQSTDFRITPPPVIRMDDVGWLLTTGSRCP